MNGIQLETIQELKSDKYEPKKHTVVLCVRT